MKINMAECDDYFNVGMIVSCKTCHGQSFEGEVMAYDNRTKILALKSNTKASSSDVHLLNMMAVADLSVVKEASEAPAPLTNLNVHKLASRVKQSKMEKRKQVNYVGVGVTPRAQKLFLHIAKTINEVRWEDKTIVVMDQVLICNPYNTENCSLQGNKSSGNNQALLHVKKLVDKFHRDSESKESSPAPPQSANA